MAVLVFAALLIGAAAIPSLQIWPVPWLIALASYFALTRWLPAFNKARPTVRFGNVTPATLGATLLVAVLSWLVLTTFNHFARPNLMVYRMMLPVSALGGVWCAGIIFSLLNPVLEELAFRVVLFEAFVEERGTWFAVAATSAIFGIGHLHGYPPGALGAVLAGIYGLALGWLRVFTGGIGLPVVAHVVADATIFHLLAEAGVWAQ